MGLCLTPPPLTFHVNNFLFPVDSGWGGLEWAKEGNGFSIHCLSRGYWLSVITLQWDTVLVSEASGEAESRIRFWVEWAQRKWEEKMLRYL